MWPLMAVAAMLISLSMVSAARAADEHVYDPLLSLTGNTAVNAEDPIADPVGEDPEKPHPPKRFAFPCGTTVDSYGNIYVASANVNTTTGFGPDGTIDIFSPRGEFVVQIPNENGPCDVAVDSEGNLYVAEERKRQVGGVLHAFIQRYEPSSYPITTATDYSVGATFEFSQADFNGFFCYVPESLAVDPSNDHLYISRRGCLSDTFHIDEYGSAAEGSPLNPLIRTITTGENISEDLAGMDVYGANHDIYVMSLDDLVYILDGGTGAVKCVLAGTGQPGGEFQFQFDGSLAIDQSNGDLYVYDIIRKVVNQFSGDGGGCPQFIGELPSPPNLKPFEGFTSGDIAVDAPCRAGDELSEPCRPGEVYGSPNEGYVFATSGEATNSHLFAFRPRVGGPPEVRGQTVSDVSESEAVLEAELNPHTFETSYRFEYTTEAAFEAEGYQGAISTPVPDGEAGDGGFFVSVSAPISGLQADTAYRFRLVASNCADGEGDPEDCSAVGEDSRFTTYSAPGSSSACPNQAVREAQGATALPDCRAYELVTPPDTGGHIPTVSMLGLAGNETSAFSTTMASPDGDSLVFGTKSGALPGTTAGGYFDTYEARRDAGTGWQGSFTGLTGTQATQPFPGGISPDHGYAFWRVREDGGTLADPVTEEAQYLRVPPGTSTSPNCAVAAETLGLFEWIGCGSLGTERQARGKWISPEGGHVVFATEPEEGATPSLQLEECAPPSGKGAVYDRTPGGATHCVSVPPVGASAETQAEFETKGASYMGISADGSTAAFAVGETLYVRRDNTETLAVADGHPVFGGLSAEGDRIFFVEGDVSSGGEISLCNLEEGGCASGEGNAPVSVDSGGESLLVNVAPDGSAAYFVSPVVLSGEEENEWGVKAQAGAENLYAWDGSEVRFVARVNPLDVSGQFKDSGAVVGGLGRWANDAVSPNPSQIIGPANDPSRSSLDGSVLAFESTADLTDYESSGHRQVYRYDAQAAAGERLVCLSCIPTGVPPASDALLESEPATVLGLFPPVNSLTQIANVTEDGSTVFFQSAERLVVDDLDGKQDVYQWQEGGTGECELKGGCLALISSPESAEDEYLYAMTPDGSDVFFLSPDLLTGDDPDGTPSIYDARVNGGFPEPPIPPGECQGESCQPAVVAPGDDPTPASSSFQGHGNPSPSVKRSCPRGKRKVRRAGKARCVPKRKSHPRHKRKSPGAERGVER